MTRHPKGQPDLGALSTGAFLALWVVILVLVALAQCHHATAPETDPSEARIIDTGRATCEPWPQCQDVEPPKSPLDTIETHSYHIHGMNHAGKIYESRGAGEIEVQALIYCGLASMGYRVRGEVPSGVAFPDKTIMWNRKGRRVEKFARFDLVVFGKDWVPISIIETKHSGYSIDFKDSRQNARYIQYGVPVDFAMNFGTASRLLDRYAERLPDYIQEHGLATDRDSIPPILAKCMAVKGAKNA